MDLGSVEFYVERTKISGMFNHGAFWNKLNIYASARQRKKKKTKKTQHSTGILLVGTEEKGPWEYKIKQHCLNVWVSAYWFIQDFFDYCAFLCRTLRHFPKHLGSRRENVIYLFVFLEWSVWHFSPRCHVRLQIVACRLSLSCFGTVEALLSLTFPLGTNLCSLKTSGCNKTWSEMQHRRAPQADGGHKNLPCDGVCAPMLCAVSPQMRPFCGSFLIRTPCTFWSRCRGRKGLRSFIVLKLLFTSA